MQHAAFYDPIARMRTELHRTLIDSTADELHLQLAEGVCLLYREDEVIGRVTAHGLDKPGFSLTDLLRNLGL